MYLIYLYDETDSKECACMHICDSLEEVLSYVKEAKENWYYPVVYMRINL